MMPAAFNYLENLCVCLCAFACLYTSGYSHEHNTHLSINQNSCHYYQCLQTAGRHNLFEH